MRRQFSVLFAFAACLLSAANAGHALERPSVATDAQGNIFHLETDGMTRKGYVVYIWQLQNLAQRDADGALSIRSQVEFDCRFRQTRTMWLTLHTERDEGGQIIRSGSVMRPEWMPVQAGTTADILLDHACRHIMR